MGTGVFLWSLDFFSALCYNVLTSTPDQDQLALISSGSWVQYICFKEKNKMFEAYLFMEAVPFPFLDLLVSVFVLMCCFKYLASKSLRKEKI